MPPPKLLPNLFIVGAPKAGTTSLYHYLDQHPQIYMSPIKEPCYFASELRPENFSEELQPWIKQEMQSLKEYLHGPMSEKRFGGLVSEWEDYLKLFQNAGAAKAIGEASVCRVWSETADRNLFCRIPDGKIIMILRNPADRAFSQYLHALTAGGVHKSFRAQIRASFGFRTRTFGKLYPFLEFGLYYEQVKRYLELFPAENIRIYLYEEYQDKPLQMLADIFGFLAVDMNFAPDTSRKHLTPRIPRFATIHYLLNKYDIGRRVNELSPRAFQPLYRTLAFRRRESLAMEPSDKAYLIGYYREDIQKLSSLLDRDLQSWLQCP